MYGILNRLIVSIACLSVALFTAASASAYEVTATFNAASSSIANGATDNGDGTVTADLTVGDTIIVDVWVANAAGDTISGAFTSLAFDTTQASFGGGAFTGSILSEATCTGFMCTPEALNPAVPLALKPNSPAAQGMGDEAWAQVVGHTNNNGTTGTGAAAPGDLTAQVAFTVAAGGAGTGQVDFTIGNLPGDAVSQGVMSETYTSLIFNAPEPGALAVSLAALSSVVLVSNRRRRLE